MQDIRGKRRKNLIVVLVIVFSALGGFFGSVVYNLRSMAYAEQKEAREHI